MKKVLFVNDERQMGGTSIVLENILNYIDLSSTKVDLLILHNNGNRLKNIPKEVNIIYGGSFFNTVDLSLEQVIKSKNLNLIFNKLRLTLYMKTGLIKQSIINQRKKILEDKYDIEIAFKDGFCALFTAYGDSKKKIHWLHSDYTRDNPNKRYNKIFKDLFKNFDLLVAVSNTVLKSFIDIYNYNNDKMVIPNIINIDEIKSKSNDKCLGMIRGNINFISVGRLHKIKGYSRLIDVFGMLKKDKILGNNVLNIVGAGDEGKILREKITQLGLENNIKFLGEQSNPYKYIKNSDMFIVSSYSESFGLVVVESLLLGKPVIYTEIPAITEMVEPGKNSIMVDNSTIGLYNGIRRIIEDNDLFNILKRHASKYKYENKQIISKINEILGG